MPESTTPVASKRCSKCREVKPLTSYRKNKSRPDGIAHYCKVCASAARAKWIEENPETNKASKRNNYQGNVERERERARQSRLRNPGANAARCKKYADKHPDRVKANNAVNKAVARGELPHVLTRQCASCEKPAEQYHHHSYEKNMWLDVIPLCRSCHRLVHTGVLALETKDAIS